MQVEDIEIHSAEYRELLSHYVIAMLCAEPLEEYLKNFLLLINVLDKHASNAMTETYIEELLINLDRSAMSKIVNSINYICRDRNIEIMSEETKEELSRLVKVRNYLAHNYLIENFSLFKNAEARSMLITELKYYTEEFNQFEQDFKPLNNLIIEALKARGIWRSDEYTKDELDELENLKLRLKVNINFEE